MDTPQELTLAQPENPISRMLVRIAIVNNYIRVHYPYPEVNDQFNSLVKRMDYTWQWPCWIRKCEEEINDRAAELARILLDSGYRVKAPRHLIEAALAGKFQPEPVRTIKRQTGGEYDGWFSIWWHRKRGGKLNDVRQGLSGSRWHRGCLMVPPEQFEAILDFAQIYDCHVSSGALALIEEARAEDDAAIVMAVEVPLEPLDMPSEIGIDDELLDK